MSLIDFMKEDPEWEFIQKNKVCIKCKKELPETFFPYRERGAYRRTECRDCLHKAAELTRKAREKIIIPKNHICPICLKTEEQVSGQGGKKNTPWCVDHNHDTGQIRGVLCHQCNRGIGAFKDDIDRMKRALNYLEEHERKKE